jgi:DNA-binding response OmpR family regulator
MLTARDSPQDENLGKHAGASAYMTKPFSPEALRNSVREALS